MLVAIVITTTAIYAFITLLSATAWPAQFDSWFDYIRHLDQLSGIEGLPAFYAARNYMSQAGIVLLMAVLLSLVLSTLIGNILSLSRLFYARSRTASSPGASPRSTGTAFLRRPFCWWDASPSSPLSSAERP